LKKIKFITENKFSLTKRLFCNFLLF